MTAWEKWAEKNGCNIRRENQPYMYYISSKNNFGKKGKNTLMNKLRKYDLVNNKHIPKEYLINDRETRLKVLAGFIDSDGHAYKERDGRRIVIAQDFKRKKLANELVYLARSLGFMCHIHTGKTQWTYKGELRRGKAHFINISGNNLEEIPTKIKRKKCGNSLVNVMNTGKIRVSEYKTGKYIGIKTDGTERFLLADFTVVHNCSNIMSSKFNVEGVDPRRKKKLIQTWTKKHERN